MSQTNSNQKFSYRVDRFTPQAPVTTFVNFVSKQYYSEQDEETAELIRRTMGEVTNDARIQMRMTVSGDESGLTEQYLAHCDDRVKFFSLALSTTDCVDRSHFRPLPTHALHRVNDATKRTYPVDYIEEMSFNPYPTDDRRKRGTRTSFSELYFVSIYHQLQVLVSSLSDRLEFSFLYHKDAEEYILLGEPIGARTRLRKKGESALQVLIRLSIPEIRNRASEAA